MLEDGLSTKKERVGGQDQLPSASLFDPGTRNLVVTEDLMAETDGRVTILFTKKVITPTRPSSTSCRICPRQTKSRTICLVLAVFKTPRGTSQIRHLARQMHPRRVKFMQKAFKDVTAVLFGYLLIDLKQETPEDLLLRTTMFPDDAGQYVYLPKAYADRTKRSRGHSQVNDTRTSN